MILTPGALLGDRYKIEQYVGEGGMQEVYRACDSHFDRTVALKVPKNASAERRFVQSARVSARIVHANVAKTLDYFDEDRRGHLVEEFIVGRDLGAVLRDNYELLDCHLAAHIFHLLVKGLAASHHAGVVHRDLKPSNVMIAGEPGFEVVKITDFGIAKMAKEELAEATEGGEASRSNSTTALGALPYMAPEMIESSRTAGTPVDIWSLGALLYRLVCGRYPFGQNWGALTKILSGKLPPKPEILTSKFQFAPLGERLWEIISVCLKKQSSSRPSADQLLAMCADLCYSDARRHVGIVKTYPLPNKKAGFILAAGQNIFFHLDSYYSTTPPETGTTVNFASFSGEPAPRAFPVLPMKDI